MLNQKITLCQSVLLIKQQKDQILEYVNCFSNHLFVYRHYLSFNQIQTTYDRNSQAYFTIFTVDGLFLLIAVRQPHALLILNLKSGEVLVARGLQQVQNHKILAFSVQPELNKSSTKKTKKFNILLKVKGSIVLKVVQIQPKIDQNPKTRFKVIDENAYSGQNILKCNPIFSNLSWNCFIICKKQFRVCLILKKNEQISVNSSTQLLEPNILRLFSSFITLGFAESNQTWAILSGDPILPSQQKQFDHLFITIFWQHKSNNQISRNMYYRDNSFIKTFNLPCNPQQFVRFWQKNGYYLLQTQNKSDHSHRCFIIHEGLNSQGYVSINLRQNSNLCCYSLSIKDSHISICQIKNNSQLFQTKIYQKETDDQYFNSQHISNVSNLKNQNDYQKQNPSQSTHQMTSPNLAQNINNPSFELLKTHKQNIKKFYIANQSQMPSLCYQHSDFNHVDNIRLKIQTEVKQRPINKQSIRENVTTFVNRKIVQHLTRNQNDELNSHSSNGSEIMVPTTVQRIFSFGSPNNVIKNHKANFMSSGSNNNMSKAINISFGIENNQKQSPIQNLLKKENKDLTEKQTDRKIAQIKEDNLLKLSHIKRQIQKISQNMIEYLIDKTNSFSNNYLNILQQFRFNFETILTPIQQKSVKNQITRLEYYNLSLNKMKRKNSLMSKILVERIAKTDILLEQCSKWLYHLGAISITKNNEIPQFQYLNKILKIKKKTLIEDQLSKQVQKLLKKSFFLLSRSDIFLNYFRSLQQNKSKSHQLKNKQLSQNSNISIRQVFKLMNGDSTFEKRNDAKKFKTPMLKTIWICQKTVLTKFSPLQQ